MGAHTDDLDDLVQSTCEQLLRARREPLPSEHPEGWVHRAITVAWVAHVKHLDARGPVMDPDAADYDEPSW